jgi:WD40 repeat protein
VTLRVHKGPVWLVGFSSDSRLLVTRSVDEKLMLWHLGLSDRVAIACRTAGPTAH